MRRWFMVLTLPVVGLVGCQDVGTSPAVGGTPSSVSGRATAPFTTAWVARGGVGRRGWGWRGGFYGGFGFRPVVPVAPIVTAPVVTTVATPVVNTVMYPSFAGSYGVFW